MLGIITAAMLGVAILPPMLDDWASLAAKAGSDVVTFESAYRSLLICFGPLLFCVFVVLFVIGVRSFWSRDRDLVGYNELYRCASMR